MKKITKITPTRLKIVDTIEEVQEVEKATLEARKTMLLKEISDIDELLTNF